MLPARMAGSDNAEKGKMMDLADYLPERGRLPRWLLNLGERFLGFHTLNQAQARVDDERAAGCTDNFFRLACKHLNLNYELEGLEHLPAEGPCVMVANHPHGLSDGLMAADAAMRVRSDIRIIANDFLNCIPDMRPYTIAVNVHGGHSARRANIAGLRQMLTWLREGHCIIVFPSGSVASWSAQDGRIIDEPWQVNIAALIRRAGASVIPMHISGHTGRLFQFATRFARQQRAALLPREIKRDGRMRHHLRLGRLIPPASMALLADDAALCDYFRLRCMLLRYPPEEQLRSPQQARSSSPIAPAQNAEVLAAEVAALPAECLCYATGNNELEVYAAEAAHIPHMLHEIGVQRERSFRAAGEGTGSACDLDLWDHHYLHLFAWDTRRRQLVGAYRLGRTDTILASRGLSGLYNAAFFSISPTALRLLSQGLEMGRAFIVPDYQRLATSLDTLWMGIGRYLATHPQYRYLYGTVSISARYSRLSRSLILSYLRQHAMNERLAAGITAHNPPGEPGLLREDARLLPTALADMRLLSPLIAELEEDGKGIPVLLRQYLRLGGRMAAFNIDEHFGNTLDCFVIVDLCRIPERMLQRYCGKAQAIHLRT